jgi:aminopeptidase N
MELSVTIPNGLMEISNGKLISKTALPNNQTRFDWYVSYPVNNYNAAIYIGDYAQFSDFKMNGKDSLAINYYCLKENLDEATIFFKNVKPTLDLYEKSFGFYPFKNDGFSILEAPYPMEHQGAVSMGSMYDPPASNQFDSAALLNTLWHETAHEWWGNNVTCKDYADFWIHESFATYAELLARKNLKGKDAYQQVINSSRPGNKEPIIGFYDVNDFHMGDVYSKGSLMLTTLQNVVNNDSSWFAMLHGIQERFRYQAVTSEDMIGYINESLQSDYTYFFNQYLRYPAIPELVLKFNQSGSSLNVSYKWKADVKDFQMPVKVTTAKNVFEFIYPVTEWKSMVLQNMTEKDFKSDTDDFYVGVKYEKN